MYILEFFYEKIIKHDLINKFSYSNVNDIPKLQKIILNFGCNSHNIKNISAALLSLELISQKYGKLTKTKKSNIILKIKKGAPIGCYVVLKKTKMYKCLFKLVLDVFPVLKNFKGILINKNDKKINSVSFYIEDVVALKELNKHFYIFKNLPALNVTLVTNTKTKKEFLYLLKSFKIPIIIKK